MDEIFQKMDNLIKKHDLNLTLSDMEAMDVPFLPIMVPKYMRKEITKILAILFSGLKIKNDRIVRLIVIVLNIMLEYFFEGDELSKLKEMLNMEVMEAVNSYHDQLNDVYGQISQYEENLKLANEEVKLVNEEKNQLIEVIKNLKRQGKLSDEDLAAEGLSI